MSSLQEREFAFQMSKKCQKNSQKTANWLHELPAPHISHSVLCLRVRFAFFHHLEDPLLCQSINTGHREHGDIFLKPYKFISHQTLRFLLGYHNVATQKNSDR